MQIVNDLAEKLGTNRFNSLLEMHLPNAPIHHVGETESFNSLLEMQVERHQDHLLAVDGRVSILYWRCT